MKLTLFALTLLSLGTVVFAKDVVISESTTSQGAFNLPFRTQPGDIILCDGAATAFGTCANGVAVSDSISFTAGGSGSFCSDPGDSGDFCTPLTSGFRAFDETAGGHENGFEAIFYLALKGGPGYDTEDDRNVTYEFISDTPEPTSILLFGTALGSLFSRHLSRKRS